jgi:hypothetical protein
VAGFCDLIREIQRLADHLGPQCCLRVPVAPSELHQLGRDLAERVQQRLLLLARLLQPADLAAAEVGPGESAREKPGSSHHSPAFLARVHACTR